MLSRSLLALAIILGLAGGAFPRKLAVTLDYSYFSGNTTGTYPPYTNKKVKVLSNKDTLIITVFQNGLKDDISGKTIISNTCVDNGINLQSSIGAQIVNAYTSKNCYNKSTPSQCYARFVPHISRLYCLPEPTGSTSCKLRTAMNGSSAYSYPGQVSQNFQDLYNPSNGGSFKCGDHTSQTFGFSGWHVMTEVSATVDTCPFTSRKECQACAFPYVSKADSLGCGCLVDYSKVMPDSLLKFYAYAYCNSVSGSNQYYLDYSRSNFDPNKGAIEVACSSPQSGDTKYMPAFTCPAGSRVDTTIADSTSRPYTGVPRPSVTSSGSGSGSGSGSDTATHSRLDSIIGILRDTSEIGEKRDSLNSWDSAARESLGDTVIAKYRLSTLDSAINAIPGSDGPCLGCVDPWHCDKIPNDSIVFDFWGTHMSIPLPISEITSQMPFDFWATMRLIQWLLVTLMMLGPWLWIAGANVGKGGS